MARDNTPELIRELYKDLEGKYDNIERMAQGGFGVVFKARQKSSGKDIAIKMVDLHKDRSGRVRSEIRQLELLENHHYVVNMYEHKEVRNYVYIVMELCKGGSLRSHILNLWNDRRECLSEKAAAYVLSQICSAVKQMHKHDVIHRDLTTNNVLITDIQPVDRIQIKLCDFGLISDCKNGAPRTMAGTPGFMAPDILNGQQYDKSVDLYSIGCILYSMLLGKDPPRKSVKEKDMIRELENRNISQNAIDLIRSLVRKEITNVEDLKRHAFLERDEIPPTRSRSTSRARLMDVGPRRDGGSNLDKIRQMRSSRGESKSSRGDSGCGSSDPVDRYQGSDRLRHIASERSSKRSNGSSENRSHSDVLERLRKEKEEKEKATRSSHRRSDSCGPPPSVPENPNPLREHNHQSATTTSTRRTRSSLHSEPQPPKNSIAESMPSRSRRKETREPTTTSSRKESREPTSSRRKTSAVEWPCIVRGLKANNREIKCILPDGDGETIVFNHSDNVLTLYRCRTNLKYQKLTIEDRSGRKREYTRYEDIEQEGDRRLYAEAVQKIHRETRKLFNLKLISYPGLPQGSSFYRMANGDCRLHPSEADKNRGVQKVMWEARTQSFVTGDISTETETAFTNARHEAERIRILWLRDSATFESQILDCSTTFV